MSNLEGDAEANALEELEREHWEMQQKREALIIKVAKSMAESCDMEWEFLFDNPIKFNQPPTARKSYWLDLAEVAIDAVECAEAGL